MTYFCVDSASFATSFKKCNGEGTCREIDHVYQVTCSNAANMRGDYHATVCMPGFEPTLG